MLHGMPKHEELVTLLRTCDPVRAEVIRDLLSQEGIPVTVTGLHHNSLLGAAGALIEIPVRLSARHKERAAAIVAAMDDEESVLVDDDGKPLPCLPIALQPWVERGSIEGAGPYRSAPLGITVPRTPRLRRAAAFFSVAIGFGAGHLYARETVTGAILLVTQIALLLRAPADPAPLLAIPFLLLFDLLGSLSACLRHNEGKPRGVGGQLAYGLSMSALAVALGLLIAHLGG